MATQRNYRKFSAQQKLEIDIRTTMRYLHHRSQVDDAKLLAGAFDPPERSALVRVSEAA